MAEERLLDIATQISEYLVTLTAKELVSWWGVNDNLKKLQETMRVIKAVLVDAENQQANGKTDALSKEWLRRLRKVLHHADDLFDEVFTVKHQTSQSLKEGNRVNRVAKKVLLPFSKSGPICFNFYVAGEIKSIGKELEAIRGDMNLGAFNLGASDRGESMLMMTRSMNKWETTSSVNPEKIVGRENDKNKIIEMLFLEPNIAEGSISVVPIVGFGGIGKTTLARLVFNDARVRNHFELATWVWLSDKDNKNRMMGKIFRALTGRDYNGLSLEQLQSGIRDSIKDKRYVLVLDDLWDESRKSWFDLMNLLGCGKRGSKIIVTTRSDDVAETVGPSTEPYKMQFLSSDESWDLFQKLALRPGSNPNLIPIGKEIVKKCQNVPLAIEAIGSALYGKDKEIEWNQFRNVQLSKIDQTGSINIMPALKLSYNHLPSQLKQCFAYCALFTEDTLCNKIFFVSQWMAQGFIKPSNGHSNLNLEDIGDQYFEGLLSRNFFQDIIEIDGTDDFLFRIHPLMHELATHVAGNEYFVEDATLVKEEITEQFHDDLQHICLYFSSGNSWEAPWPFLKAVQIRSLWFCCHLEVQICVHKLENMLSNFKRLRSLELRGIMIETVPDSICVLRHLRSLTIRNCPIKCLPNSIKRLWNLQTLILQECSELAELPTGISRLINLRLLYLWGCNLLAETPTDFWKLKSLQKLSHFVVGKNNGLDALANMNLREYLEIDYRKWREDTISEARKANLQRKHRLTLLVFKLGCLDSTPDDAVSLLEELKPPQSLKELQIVGYQGEILPHWMNGIHTQLSDVVRVVLRSFKRCRFLSSGFSRLLHLKDLELSELMTLEYIDIGVRSFKANEYFPCLEYLKLSKLPELKGWSRAARDEEDGSKRPMLPCISTLEIDECPELRSMPLMPRLRTLKWRDIHVSLLTGEKAATSSCSELTVSELSSVQGLVFLSIMGLPSLQTLEVSDCHQLMRVNVEPPTSIKDLTIQSCTKLSEIQGLHHLSSTLEFFRVEDCEELDELPTSLDCLTLLQSLSISKLPNLTALPGSIDHLTALHTLSITYCPQLVFLPTSFGHLTHLRSLIIEDSPKMSSYIGSSLFSDHLSQFTLLEELQIGGFPDLTTLPVSIGHLFQLRELTIRNFPQVKVLPEQFTNLTALQKLKICGCPHLDIRCKEPDGQDWPLIGHIPKVILED